MIMLALWACVGFLGGLVSYLVFPWVCARIAGGDYPEKVANGYAWLAMTATGRGAFVFRDHGGLDFVSPSFDAPKQADEASIGGKTGHHKDDTGIMSRLQNKPFALALEDAPSYVVPLYAELGKRASEAMQDARLGHVDEETMVLGVTIPETSRLVRMKEAVTVLTGDANRDDGELAHSFGKKSQEGFNERVSFGQTMIVLLSLLGSAVVMWFLAGQTGGGGGGTTVPSGSTVGGMLLFAAATSRISADRLRMAGALALPAVFLLVVVVFSTMQVGIIGMLLTLGILVGVAAGPPVMIALWGSGMPGFLGGPAARIHWVLAQLAMWEGCFVRRDTGEYEYRQLRTGDGDTGAGTNYHVVCEDGTVVPIAGTRGDLYRMGWRPLGITEEKSEKNVGEWSVEIPSDVKTDQYGARAEGKRQGYNQRFPVAGEGEWTISMPKLWASLYPSSESQLVERGLLQALEEHGGKNQIGFLYLTAATLAASVIGGAMGLIAGGGI